MGFDLPLYHFSTQKPQYTLRHGLLHWVRDALEG